MVDGTWGIHRRTENTLVALLSGDGLLSLQPGLDDI